MINKANGTMQLENYLEMIFRFHFTFYEKQNKNNEKTNIRKNKAESLTDASFIRHMILGHNTTIF
jgi:hypothetical protein